jgi:hypothetical protein
LSARSLLERAKAAEPTARFASCDALADAYGAA